MLEKSLLYMVVSRALLVTMSVMAFIALGRYVNGAGASSFLSIFLKFVKARPQDACVVYNVFSVVAAAGRRRNRSQLSDPQPPKTEELVGEE